MVAEKYSLEQCKELLKDVCDVYSKDDELNIEYITKYGYYEMAKIRSNLFRNSFSNESLSISFDSFVVIEKKCTVEIYFIIDGKSFGTLTILKKGC